MSIQAQDTPYNRNGLTAVAELLGDAFTLAYGWRERSRQRRSLMRLDDHMLHDIGLSRSDVEREASKPFWRN
jgi:uncharacterized protein YjiS (DUF1127 family)